MSARDDIWFAADMSVRYHRRRASFLERTSAMMSAAVLIGGAGAFASLFGEATTFAKVATLIVAFVGVVQIVFQVDRCAAEHRRWMKEWQHLLLDVKRNDDPDRTTVSGWEERRAEIEDDCVGELRALQIDCWNRTAIAWRSSEPPTYIPRWQRPLIQVMSFEAWYANPAPNA